MLEKQIHQVFLKPKAGSSASGVMAFRYRNEKSLHLYTTIDLKDDALFNSLKLKHYNTENSIHQIWSKIPFKSLHVELWLPKYKEEKLNIDFKNVKFFLFRLTHIFTQIQQFILILKKL